jgi:HD-GYP domain-containing protein (c-di-GMP phosphodiesterase class II)
VHNDLCLLDKANKKWRLECEESNMKSEIYKAISLDTLLPQTLPGVALFIKTANNYVLYKARGLPFTEIDKKRLIKNRVEELYVYSGELSDYNKYVESNLGKYLHDVSLTVNKRQEILCKTSVNYVNELFDSHPNSIQQNMGRCKHLVRYIINEKLSASVLMETLGGLVKHSNYTYVHSIQVCLYSIALHSSIFELNEEDLIDIGVGSVFHDYGKKYIPVEILEKPAKLTPAEYQEIKNHCEYGYDLLKMLDVFSPISLDIVKSHHEKMDGKGYPQGLNGNGISESARIVAIADVYSALTTNRSYRDALDKDSALDIMFNEMKGAFDVHYLNVFSAMLSE